MLKKLFASIRYTVSILKNKSTKFFLLLGMYSVVLVISSFLMPVLFRSIFDVIENNSRLQLMYISLGAFSIFIMTTLFDFYVSVYGNTKSANIIYHTAAKQYTEMHQLPYDIREKKCREEDIFQRIQSGTDATLALWVTLCNLILSASVMAIFTVYAFNQALMYSAIILLLIAVLLIRSYLEGKKNAVLSASFESIQVEKERISYDLIKRIEYIAVNGLEDHALCENHRVNDLYWNNRKQHLINQLLFSSICGTIIESLKPLSLLVFYPLRAVGRISIGQISANNNILSQVESQSNKFNQSYTSIQYFVEPIMRSYELFSNQIQWENNFTDSYEPLIEFDHVDLSVDDTAILHIPDLSVRPGEKIAVIGKNGSGKSTLLRMFMGYLKPTKGSVKVGGFDPYKMSWLKRKQIFSYTTAKPLLYNVSCLENISMGSDVLTTIDKSILKTFHIEQEMLSQNANNISEGQKQRINMLRMTVSNTPIRILDEPTSALDGDCGEEIMKYLYANSQTLIFATHNLNHIQYADRVIVLKDGEITLDCASNCEKIQEYLVLGAGEKQLY